MIDDRAPPSFAVYFFPLLLTGLSAGPAAAQDDADPVALITAIYKSYKTDQPGLEQMYSRRLQALIDKDASETPEGMVGRIDWDVFVDGQDWQLRDLKIALVSRTDSAAQVRATFLNFDKRCDMLFDLVLEDGHWRIDEIRRDAEAALDHVEDPGRRAGRHARQRITDQALAGDSQASLMLRWALCGTLLHRALGARA